MVHGVLRAAQVTRAAEHLTTILSELKIRGIEQGPADADGAVR
jgi:hypothetical protein